MDLVRSFVKMANAVFIYEACPESKDTEILNMYIFNLQKRHCE
jgi:hypothetical protein